MAAVVGGTSAGADDDMCPCCVTAAQNKLSNKENHGGAVDCTGPVNVAVDDSPKFCAAGVCTAAGCSVDEAWQELGTATFGSPQAIDCCFLFVLDPSNEGTCAAAFLCASCWWIAASCAVMRTKSWFCCCCSCELRVKKKEAN